MAEVANANSKRNPRFIGANTAIERQGGARSLSVIA
jgi:hypothetical protein